MLTFAPDSASVSGAALTFIWGDDCDGSFFLFFFPRLVSRLRSQISQRRPCTCTSLQDPLKGAAGAQMLLSMLRAFGSASSCIYPPPPPSLPPRPETNPQRALVCVSAPRQRSPPHHGGRVSCGVPWIRLTRLCGRWGTLWGGGGGSLQRRTTCAALLQRRSSLRHNTWLKGHPLSVLFGSFLICWLERFLRLCD